MEKIRTTFLIGSRKYPMKELPKFVAFHVKDFYSSIKEHLLNKALGFVDKCVNLWKDDKKIISHAGKSLPLTSNEPGWIKKKVYSTDQWTHMTEKKYVNS